jgi:hypothetical protein
MPHGIGIGNSQGKYVVYATYGTTSGTSATYSLPTGYNTKVGDVIVFTYNAASTTNITNPSTTGILWLYPFPVTYSGANRNAMGFVTTAGTNSFTIAGVTSGSPYCWAVFRNIAPIGSPQSISSSSAALTSGSTANITVSDGSKFANNQLAYITYNGTIYNVLYYSVTGNVLNNCKTLGAVGSLSTANQLASTITPLPIVNVASDTTVGNAIQPGPFLIGTSGYYSGSLPATVAWFDGAPGAPIAATAPSRVCAMAVGSQVKLSSVQQPYIAFNGSTLPYYYQWAFTTV